MRRKKSWNKEQDRQARMIRRCDETARREQLAWWGGSRHLVSSSSLSRTLALVSLANTARFSGVYVHN
jgi:hypothetical protein